MIGLPMIEERFLTIDQIAEYLGFNRETVRKWIVSGDLVASKPGKEYRIRQSDLDEFMTRKQVKPRKDEDQEV